jgi:hypothetical protein
VRRSLLTLLAVRLGFAVITNFYLVLFYFMLTEPLIGYPRAH